jgi:hypothetical protein
LVNDRGFEVEVIECSACGEEFYCSPNDPHDLCECSACVELERSNRDLQSELCSLVDIPMF